MSKKENLLAAAQKNLRKGLISKAISDFQAVVELDPRDVRSRQKLAELLGRNKRVADSLVEYGFIAKYYAENGFYLKAIAVYKQMQNLDSTQIELSLRMAELHAKQGLLGNAQAEYRRVVAYYEEQGMVPEAINVLQRMQELDPQNINVRVKIAETYAKGGMKDKGWEALSGIFELLSVKSNSAAASKLYKLFWGLYGSLPEFQFGYAQTQIELGEITDAVAILKGLRTQGYDSRAVDRALCRAYRRAGQHQDELQTWSSLLEKSPEDLDLRASLVEVLILKQDYPEALEELETWKEVFASRERLHELRGFYESLLENLPKEEQVRETLRSIYELTGEGDKLFNLMAAGENGGQQAAAEETLEGSIFREALQDLEDETSAISSESGTIDVSELPDEAVIELSESEEGPEEELELDLGFVLELDEEPPAEHEQARSEEPEFTAEPIARDQPKEPHVEVDTSEIDFDFSAFDLEIALEEPEKTEKKSAPKKGRKGSKTDIWVEDGQIEVDDTESHYNLGIAYKEMGLLDEAITEFQRAMKNPARQIASLTLQGLCRFEKGDVPSAISTFEQGLQSEIASASERANMQYELGLICRASGDLERARACFEKVSAFDASFRDVEKMLASC